MGSTSQWPNAGTVLYPTRGQSIPRIVFQPSLNSASLGPAQTRPTAGTSQCVQVESPVPRSLTADCLPEPCPGGVAVFPTLPASSEAAAAPSPHFLMSLLVFTLWACHHLALLTALPPPQVSGPQPPGTLPVPAASHGGSSGSVFNQRESGCEDLTGGRP